jgi:hypothetical protein
MLLTTLVRRRWLRRTISVVTAFFLVVTSSGFGPDYRDRAAPALVDGPVHNGVEVMIDLPTSEHVRNFAMPLGTDKGLCVFASMTMAARWHHIRELMDLMYWDKDGKPHSRIPEGGGWPEKVDEVLRKFAPNLKYVQQEGTDPAILDKFLAEGAPVCVTYGYGERYQMQTIYHMVLLVHFDAQWAVILDNNFPGTFEWMPREEFLRRAMHPGGKFWAYGFLAAPPPPVPHN